jgi:hypothetical protein
VAACLSDNPRKVKRYVNLLVFIARLAGKLKVEISERY